MHAARRLSPTGEFGNDGGSLDPLEVMFVKAKSHLVAGEAASAKKALKYAAWQAQVRAHARAGTRSTVQHGDGDASVECVQRQAAPSRPAGALNAAARARAHAPPLLPVQSSAWPPGDFSALAANEFVDARAKFRAPHVLVARARGARCFDFDAYMKANPDLKHLWGNITGLWYHFVYTGQFEPRQFRCAARQLAAQLRARTRAASACHACVPGRLNRACWLVIASAQVDVRPGLQNADGLAGH